MRERLTSPKGDGKGRHGTTSSASYALPSAIVHQKIGRERGEKGFKSSSAHQVRRLLWEEGGGKNSVISVTEGNRDKVVVMFWLHSQALPPGGKGKEGEGKGRERSGACKVYLKLIVGKSKKKKIACPYSPRCAYMREGGKGPCRRLRT